MSCFGMKWKGEGRNQQIIVFAKNNSGKKRSEKGRKLMTFGTKTSLPILGRNQVKPLWTPQLTKISLDNLIFYTIIVDPSHESSLPSFFLFVLENTLRKIIIFPFLSSLIPSLTLLSFSSQIFCQEHSVRIPTEG